MGDRQTKNALFDGFADVAKTLGNGRRVELVDVLAQGERHVEELATEIDQSVANTSTPPTSARRSRTCDDPPQRKPHLLPTRLQRCRTALDRTALRSAHSP